MTAPTAPVVRCPYGDCTMEGTQDEVDEHCSYMTSMHVDDPEHRQDRLRDRH